MYYVWTAVKSGVIHEKWRVNTNLRFTQILLIKLFSPPEASSSSSYSNPPSARLAPQRSQHQSVPQNPTSLPPFFFETVVHCEFDRVNKVRNKYLYTNYYKENKLWYHTVLQWTLDWLQVKRLLRTVWKNRCCRVSIDKDSVWICSKLTVLTGLRLRRKRRTDRRRSRNRRQVGGSSRKDRIPNRFSVRVLLVLSSWFLILKKNCFMVPNLVWSWFKAVFENERCLKRHKMWLPSLNTFWNEFTKKDLCHLVEMTSS